MTRPQYRYDDIVLPTTMYEHLRVDHVVIDEYGEGSLLRLRPCKAPVVFVGARPLEARSLGWLAAIHDPAPPEFQNRHTRARWIRNFRPVLSVASDALLEGDRPRAIAVLCEMISVEAALSLTAPSPERVAHNPAFDVAAFRAPTGHILMVAPPAAWIVGQAAYVDAEGRATTTPSAPDAAPIGRFLSAKTKGDTVLVEFDFRDGPMRGHHYDRLIVDDPHGEAPPLTVEEAARLRSLWTKTWPEHTAYHQQIARYVGEHVAPTGGGWDHTLGEYAADDAAQTLELAASTAAALGELP